VTPSVTDEQRRGRPREAAGLVERPPAALVVDHEWGEVAPLDVHEGIGDPRAGSCLRWPEHFRILNQRTGELFEGMCKATNLCRYCQSRYVLETVEMLSLDAMEYAPTVWAVFTAREHLTRADCRDHLRQVRKATRKLWPVEWFVQVEFQRRGALHLNLTLKGVPVDERDRFLEVASRVWCGRVDAEPWAQHVEPIYAAEGLVRYLQKTLAHGLKREQAPPLGWRGHRTSQTRGYLVRPASVMREEARRSLKLKRLLWKGLSVEQAELELAAPAEYALVNTPGFPLGPDHKRLMHEAALAPFRRTA
jgi:hypothetical protein